MDKMSMESLFEDEIFLFARDSLCNGDMGNHSRKDVDYE